MTTKITDADALAVLDAVINAKRLIEGIVQPMGDAHPVAAILIPDIAEARAHIAARLAAGGVPVVDGKADSQLVTEINVALMPFYDGRVQIDHPRAAIAKALIRYYAAPTPEGES